MGTRCKWVTYGGDGASFLKFLNTISRFYQEMPAIEHLHVLERRLRRTNQLDSSLLPLLRYLSDCRSIEEVLGRMMKDQTYYEQAYLHFSGEQLRKVRSLSGGNTVTIQDAITAYIIYTLNTHIDIRMMINDTFDIQVLSSILVVFLTRLLQWAWWLMLFLFYHRMISMIHDHLSILPRRFVHPFFGHGIRHSWKRIWPLLMD
jgi:hypothetical protein